MGGSLVGTSNYIRDVVRDDLGLPVALAAVVIPRAGLDPALDCDLLALAEELAARLGKPVPADDVVVLRLLLALADVLVRRDAELRDGLAAREAAHLRIPGQAPG